MSTNSRSVHVHIGEVKIGKDCDKLQALLGSCVGIGLLYNEKKIYGLAHCLLAESPKKMFSIGGRYVDQAIFSLLKLMKIGEKSIKDIQAVVAGGSNMTMPNHMNPKQLVGVVNSRFTVQKLREKKIKIIHEDFGGTLGRKIFIDCQSGQYEINKIPKLEEV
ncbi:MAG: chemotaxis protein CheD [Verrucomicrobiota bacterium]